MELRIAATEAARNFSDILNRIRYRREEFVIERGGEPLCRMIPAGPPRFTVADLVRLFRAIPKPDAGYWDDLDDAVTRGQALPKSPWSR